ncbi:aspartate/glutamate racemase family protein [Aquabacter spiritensis]|uniref:Aspartate racemase n=1 Tax=Aquabacter spiritensis TaxID=933073 RepID=A0A4R3M0A3_9HYPH|nr:aspartate/glutamate racemase family protein [Aquabacter spiritensis]TCT06133.1 aspartate racemase [Aquabacter spiritensis]
MRTIGLIGGMSWESTAVYYRRINEQVRDRLGGLHSAPVLMHSVNFEDIVGMQKAGDWDAATAALRTVAGGLEGAGARCLLICTNTMHKLADAVQDSVSVPLLNIIDITAEALIAAGARKPLLLATRYTMEHGFYLDRMRAHHGLAPMVPDAADRGVVHDVIFEELCRGVIRPESRQSYLDIIAKGRAAGADSVILGCTEIGLLIGPEDLDLPTFDSTLLHADKAVDFCLSARLPDAAAA